MTHTIYHNHPTFCFIHGSVIIRLLHRSIGTQFRLHPSQLILHSTFFPNLFKQHLEVATIHPCSVYHIPTELGLTLTYIPFKVNGESHLRSSLAQYSPQDAISRGKGLICLCLLPGYQLQRLSCSCPQLTCSEVGWSPRGDYEPPEHRWILFDRVRSLVRCLRRTRDYAHEDVMDPEPLSREIWQHLHSRYPRTTPIFPNIHTLHWAHTWSAGDYLELLAPSLRKITLQYVPPEDYQGSFGPISVRIMFLNAKMLVQELLVELCHKDSQKVQEVKDGLSVPRASRMNNGDKKCYFLSALKYHVKLAGVQRRRRQRRNCVLAEVPNHGFHTGPPP